MTSAEGDVCKRKVSASEGLSIKIQETAIKKQDATARWYDCGSWERET